MKIIPIGSADGTLGSTMVEDKAFLNRQAIPLSLYVHFPWCVKKCPYCDFNSHAVHGEIPQDEFVAALIADLEAALPQIWGRRVISVFIGGGTPSLFSAEALATLLEALRARLNLLPDAEITLEANPGTVDVARFAAYRAAGVNRLSLGVQSFDDVSLRALARIHNGDEARRAVEVALQNFPRVNLDLMYGLPQQTVAQAKRDFANAVAAGVTHVSAYQLTIEPNTLFANRPPVLPADDVAAEIEAVVQESLAERGFERYEISAYAKPGARCQHNLNYWTFGDYLGIGPGAHSKLTRPDAIVREERARDPKAYLSGDRLESRHAVAPKELPAEFMMNALRLLAGFPASLFEERTGSSLATLQAPLLAAQRRGFIVINDQHIKPTPLGINFLNDLVSLFMP